MELHHFFAPDMRKAIELVKNSLGMDAIILSQKTVDGGIEIQAAIDHKEEEDEKIELLEKAFPKKPIIKENEAITSSSTQNETNATITGVKAEISMLRTLLESQMKLLSDKKKQSLNRVQILIKTNFENAGFNKELCNIILDNIDSEKEYHECLANSIQFVSNLITPSSKNIFADGGMLAFVGPTGVGKTSCVAKIATKYVLEHSASEIGIISTDFYRIGGFEQLNTYSKILKIPFLSARNSLELMNALNSLKHKKLVLIDTAGVSPIFGETFKKLSWLKNEKIKSYLVLSANSQYNALKKYMTDFMNFGIDECIVTKVDESNTIGGLLSLLVENNIPISYYGHGQTVPDHFSLATPEMLVNISLSLNYGMTPIEDKFENEITICEEAL